MKCYIIKNELHLLSFMNKCCRSIHLWSNTVLTLHRGRPHVNSTQNCHSFVVIASSNQTAERCATSWWFSADLLGNKVLFTSYWVNIRGIKSHCFCPSLKVCATEFFLYIWDAQYQYHISFQQILEVFYCHLSLILMLDI